MDDSGLICIGVIAGAHGVRGQVRLRSLTEAPEDVFAYRPVTDEDGKPVALKRIGAMKDAFIVAIEGLQDRDAAEALKGLRLYVDRGALPPAEEGAFYNADLIGLEARCDDPKGEGTVAAVHDYGAGAFLEIRPPEGTSFMIPFTKLCVPEVRIQEGYVRILPPAGWLEKAGPEAET